MIKKLFTILLATLLMVSCASAANVDPATTESDATSTTQTSTDATPADPDAIPNEPKAQAEILVFDNNLVYPPLNLYPIQRLSYNVFIDYPFSFEAQQINEDDPLSCADWVPVEPITLYQSEDGSWTSLAPGDPIPENLKSYPFYLMEPGYNYRLVADFGNRTQNIREFYPAVTSYTIYNLYSGLLEAGRTGNLAIELNEYLSGVSIIHRCQLHIASTKGVNFMPRAYTSAADGKFIVEYYPSDSTDRHDYYNQTSFDIIFPAETVPVEVHNLLY